MGIFKWLRKDIAQEDQNRRNLLPSGHNGLNNEAYRNAVRAFLDRRRTTIDPRCIVPPINHEMRNVEVLVKKNNNRQETNSVPGVPHVVASELFEIGWVAGTEDRYLEFIYAEWHNTRVSLKRNTHPGCQDAVKADLEVLTEVRHPNVLLLMATTQTDDHGLVAIFEPIDCTLYNYIHEQGVRMSMQESTKYAGKIAEALRHAHVRGYVHGALSSHCIYLTSGDTRVKLGGWELATSIDSPKSNQEFEERLRAEIYRWQAPEIFHGYQPSKESDIYGLSLLLWEMCTMHIPWNGLDVGEVKQQYIHHKCGIIIDIYNFPSLLSNLLEIGLQLDITKRTYDMHKMRRFLQRLEMQYETENLIYIDHCTNNNQPTKSLNGLVCATPRINSPATSTCKTTDTPKASTPKKSPRSEKYTYSQLVQSTSKRDVYPDQINLFISNEATDAKIMEQDKNFKLEKQKCKERMSDSKIDSKVINNSQLKDENEYVENDNERKYMTKTRNEQNACGSKRNTDTENNNNYSTSIFNRKSFTAKCESENNVVQKVTKLKEHLAAEREKFFGGNGSSEIHDSNTTPRTRHRILSQAKSQRYERHKPTSHRTNLESKQTKLSTVYDPFLIKPASHHNQRLPYSSVPKQVKEAILQPQVLHSDSQSFFESSLWKKEKLICLSKMMTATQNHSQDLSNTDGRKEHELTESPSSDETCTVKNNIAAKNARDFYEDSTPTMTGITDVNPTGIYISRSKPIQALKDALDRATDIVHSVPDSKEIRQSFPLTDHDFDMTTDESEYHELMFENLHRSKLCNINPNDEIRSIEKWMVDKNDSLFFTKSSEDEISNSWRQDILNSERPDSEIFKNCVTVDEPLISRKSESSTMSQVNQNGGVISKNVINETEEDSFETNFMTMFSNKARENECKSCHKGNTKRRQSLPASLGQFRLPNNSSSRGKLPIRKLVVPDNSVEDIYIDDEFGANLNVNLVLLNDSLPSDDDDFLLSSSNNLYPHVHT